MPSTVRVKVRVHAKRTSKRDRILDEIKDKIDRLHELRSDKQRTNAANELVEYLQLHHNARPGL